MFYNLEHCITPDILHRLTKDDMKTLCPKIADRFILEDYIASLEQHSIDKHTSPSTEVETISIKRKSVSAKIIL